MNPVLDPTTAALTDLAKGTLAPDARCDLVQRALRDPQLAAELKLAIGKAAQHKTVGLLHQKLAPSGVYVGEVVVLGMVKGTAFDSGSATLEASAIADRFWELHQNRTPASVNIS